MRTTGASRLEDAIALVRAALLSHEQATASDLAAVYADAYARISAHLDALTAEIEQRQSRGQPVTEGALLRHTRLSSLLSQIDAEMEGFAGYADSRIAQSQQTAILAAQQHARDLIAASAGIPPADVPGAFRRLNTPVIEEMVGRLSNGSPLRDFLKGIAPQAVDSAKAALTAGVGQGLNPRVVARQLRDDLNIPLTRALTIARTEMLSTYRAAALETYRANDDVCVGWMWDCSKGVRTCAMCLAMDGQVFGLDVPFASHVNCIPAGAMVAAPGVVSATARWFEGEIVEIETAQGNRLAVTPNHPILTPEGWIAAGLLNEGGYVVSGLGAERVVSAVYPDDYNTPALIEDVAEAFMSSPGVISRSVPISAENFHGDGEGSQVCIVGTNSLLRNTVDSSLRQPFTQQQLCRRCVGLLRFSRLRPADLGFEGVMTAPARCIGGEGVLFSLFRRARSGQQAVSLGVIPNRDAGHYQSSSDGTPHRPVLLGERVFRNPVQVIADNLLHWKRILSPVSRRRLLSDQAQARSPVTEQTSELQFVAQSFLANVETKGNALRSLAGNISLDRILKITVREFSGHVYNLETRAGWFIANNIITHNCRCSPIPITKSWSDLGVSGVEETSAASWERETGAEWFERQPERVKMDVLGPGKLREYQAGRLTLKDLVGYRVDPEWGPQRWERSLKQVREGVFSERPPR